MCTMNTPKYISHIRKNAEGEIEAYQSNETHCKGVAELACKFAAEFGMGTWGYLLGMLHDKGKEKKQFQEYIRDVNGIEGHKDYKLKEKDHAYVGAIMAHRIYGKTALNLFCNQIASHHRGLYDYCDLEELLSRQLPSEVEEYAEKLQLEKACFNLTAEGLNHLSRMLFSCLVDADYLDTEAFMNPDASAVRGSQTPMKTLLEKLMMHMDTLQKSSAHVEVNVIRREVFERCVVMSTQQKGFYSLTVPTGGGKTLSAVAWALGHAVHNGMNRIIIAIPYNSIIVQTARILKDIFGEENVLEHHSNFDPLTIKDTAKRHKAKLATENWDYPIVVTTNVQLFESVYSNRTSDCRKLHSIANSVIVLDEVQTLPTNFLQPVVDSLKAYQSMFGISVLFSTASQPILSGIIEGCNPKAAFDGISNITEIIPKEYALFERLRRVNLCVDKDSSTYEDIAKRLAKHNKVLCIVNTRNDAREIFTRLPQEGLTLHLSRMMCPVHVAQTIEKIKQALKNDSEEVIRVVATQLIEAGVDIDFPVVYRQEAGLDSILQAAGRCNREGKLDMATTYVFSLSKEHNLHGSVVDANYARLNMTNVKDWFAPEAMTEYFRQLYSRKETFDEKDIKNLLYKRTNMCFEEASKAFRLIEEVGKSVVINMDDIHALVERMKTNGITYSSMKQLSQYSVTIHERDFQKLESCGAIEEVIEGIYVVNDRAQYDDNIGLRLDNHWLNEILTI